MARVPSFTDTKVEVKQEHGADKPGFETKPGTPTADEPEEKQSLTKVEADVKEEGEEVEDKLVLESEPLPPPGKLGVKAGLDKAPGSRAEAVRQIYRRACVIHCPKWPKARFSKFYLAILVQN